MYPPLGVDWESRSLRVAMPRKAWRAFESLVRCFPASTLARSHGKTLNYLLRQNEAATGEWLDWDQQKQLRLLHTPLGIATDRAVQWHS